MKIPVLIFIIQVIEAATKEAGCPFFCEDREAFNPWLRDGNNDVFIHLIMEGSIPEFSAVKYMLVCRQGYEEYKSVKKTMAIAQEILNKFFTQTK